jgi:hypothetical protein
VDGEGGDGTSAEVPEDANGGRRHGNQCVSCWRGRGKQPETSNWGLVFLSDELRSKEPKPDTVC